MRERRRFRGLIERHFPNLRKSRRTTIADLSCGLMHARRVGLAPIARAMRDTTTVRHRIKRAWRFAQNEGIQLTDVSRALCRWVFAAEGSFTATVALDWTYLGQYQMLAAKVAVDGRAVPIAWRVVWKGHFSRKDKSQNKIESDLVRMLTLLLPPGRWVLVADRGFCRAAFIQKLKAWGVDFVIRASGNTWVEGEDLAGPLDAAPRKAGRLLWWPQVAYQKSRRVQVGLVVSHAEPAPEPWYLVTSLGDPAEAVRLYRRRMWIEEAFRDAKSRLGLDQLWMATPERMERMMILVAVVMFVSVLAGLRYRRRHPGRDPQLTTKRRGGALSVFRTGRALIRQYGLPPDLAGEPLLPAGTMP